VGKQLELSGSLVISVFMIFRTLSGYKIGLPIFVLRKLAADRCSVTCQLFCCSVKCLHYMQRFDVLACGIRDAALYNLVEG
jgi:hypothetical protein